MIAVTASRYEAVERAFSVRHTFAKAFHGYELKCIRRRSVPWKHEPALAHSFMLAATQYHARSPVVIRSVKAYTCACVYVGIHDYQIGLDHLM